MSVFSGSLGIRINLTSCRLWVCMPLLSSLRLFMRSLVWVSRMMGYWIQASYSRQEGKEPWPGQDGSCYSGREAAPMLPRLLTLSRQDAERWPTCCRANGADPAAEQVCSICLPWFCRVVCKRNSSRTILTKPSSQQPGMWEATGNCKLPTPIGTRRFKHKQQSGWAARVDWLFVWPLEV